MAQFIAEGINGEITVDVKHIDITDSANIQSFNELEWFAEIPAENVELTGIPFEIQKSVILTHGYIENGRSAFYPGLPDEISLKVGVQAGYLAFLHTALFQKNSFRWGNGEAIAGEYRIRYEDDLTIRLPVTVGGNIRNMGSPVSVDLPFEYPALAPDHRTLLSVCCWKNPYPDNSIRSIDIISVEDTTTSIALFAVTAMEERPWDEKIFSSAQDIQTAARRIRITSWRKKAEKQIKSILLEKNLDPDILPDLPVNKSILKVEDSDELLRALDLERTELKAVREASEAGDKKRIEDALAKFLRSKKDWLRKVLKIKDTVSGPTIDTGDADKLLNNRFGHSDWSYDYTGREIDFYAVPTDLKPEPHWYFTHGLQYVGLPLAEAYAATGEEKYPERMFDYFRDIIRKCPVEDADGVGDNDYFMPAADADGDGWPDRPGQAQAWEASTSSTRLGIWIRCLALCMNSKHLTDELLMSLYKSILEQIRHTNTQSPFYMEKRTNHATSIAFKLIEWAVCFPEFKGAAEWKDMGFEMILAFYRPFWEGGMIYPDGSTYESHTGGYGSVLVRELDKSIKLLEMSSFSIPPSLIRAREQMYEWLLCITTPLGYSSSISMVYHDFYGFDVKEVSREAFDATKREDFLYIGSGGSEGKKPDYESYPFTSRMPCYGGVYIMRSGWDREALYLCAKMGPMHYRHSSNQGHFVIDAYGSELVIGPGYAQEGSEFDAYTGKYMSGDGMSYNTIAVDGVGQKQGNRETYALGALGNTWITNHLFGFLKGDYDFNSRGIDVLHTRSILFIKSEYWLIIDRLTHTGSMPENHSLRMKYQLDKDITAERDGNSVYARNEESKVSLHIHQFDKESTLTLVKGQKTPRIEGWLAVAGDAWPAPAAIYEKRSPVPAGFETLFYPLPKGETAAIHTERDGAILKAVIKRSGQSFTDLFAVSSSSSSNLSFEGKLAWLRLDNRGVKSIVIIEGKRLSFREGSIDIELDRPANLCITREEGDAWRIYADLKNYPALKIRFNTSDIILDPGLSVTMCLRR